MKNSKKDPVINNTQDHKSQGQPMGWTLISPSVMSANDISLPQKVLLGRILGLLNKFGYCFATNAWLGKEIGLSEFTARKHIYKLIELGYLRSEVDRGGSNRNGSMRRLYPTEKVLIPTNHIRLEGWSNTVRGVTVDGYSESKNTGQKDLQIQGVSEVNQGRSVFW
ncbi:unnamed protein product [marine sediment metagenome]|uniref:Helix-turn-helix domain-containing protein n=1 Tax=marine sediment metagenome TaxID=412755 RepID=X1FHA1_9ZZZZ